MSKFRFTGSRPHSVEYGLPAPRLVEPDEIIDVPDTVARPGLRYVDARTGQEVVKREDQTWADSYRDHPHFAEVLVPSAATKAPGPAKRQTDNPAADGGTDTEEAS